MRACHVPGHCVSLDSGQPCRMWTGRPCVLRAQPALAKSCFPQLRLPNLGCRLLGGKSKSHTPVTAVAAPQVPVTSSLGASEQKPECFWAKAQHAAHFFFLPVMLCEWVPALFLMGCANVARRGLTRMPCLHVLIFSHVARERLPSRILLWKMSVVLDILSTMRRRCTSSRPARG